jgi:hypothetical protein
MRLAVSFAEKTKSYFLNLQIKSYGCLKFLGEVWARRACVGANEEELTNHKKNWEQKGEGKGAGGCKNGGPAGARLAAVDQRSLTVGPLVSAPAGDRW